MTINFKQLNVASLDYTDIVTNLINFFKQEPTLSDIDWDNKASAANMMVNILATATAYNGVYAQFGYRESFLSTANLLPSIVGLAANSSVLLEVKNSANTTRTVSISGVTLDAYTPFSATATNNGFLYFFNTQKINANTTTTTTLYSGVRASQFTSWDFTTQSMEIPLTVDPNTISMYTVDGSGNEIVWTKVNKSSFDSSSNQYYFTVVNTANAYLVTANLPESFAIPTNYTVYVRAVISDGSSGNGATIIAPSNVTFVTSSTPYGGYDDLTADQARAKVQFSVTAQHKCVTIADYVKAILVSGITGTDDESLITVTNGNQPCTLNVYVSGLSTANSITLMSYLADRAVAGINLVYQQ
jgi:hypothetical protein